jgi:hypothetical protein
VGDGRVEGVVRPSPDVDDVARFENSGLAEDLVEPVRRGLFDGGDDVRHLARPPIHR